MFSLRVKKISFSRVRFLLLVLFFGENPTYVPSDPKVSKSIIFLKVNKRDLLLRSMEIVPRSGPTL